MKMKTILFLFFFYSSLHATLIKGKAKVYTMDTHIAFAVLCDNTIVSQSIDWREKVMIDIHCFVDKSVCRNGKLVTKTMGHKILMSDTVYLYSDTTLQNKIGYSWPATDSVSISFQDGFRYKSPNYFGCWIYGHVDSSSIKEFNPWNNIVQRIDDKNALFTTSYAELNGLMLSINNYCTPIKGKGLEYSETYDEETPEPNTPLIYVFQNGTLKAIWTKIKLKIKNKEKFYGSNLYYDDSMKAVLQKIKKNIKASLNYQP
jgi:hypothetical protein